MLNVALLGSVESLRAAGLHSIAEGIVRDAVLELLGTFCVAAQGEKAYTMRAQFSSKCACCGGTLRQGSWIVWDRDSKTAIGRECARRIRRTQIRKHGFRAAVEAARPSHHNYGVCL